MLDPWRLREGGHVQRCHVIPHNGSYTVAEHSWQVATLLMALHPDPSMAGTLLRAILLHDVQERWTGDLPLPSGEAFDDLRVQYEAAEDHVRGRLGLCPADFDLTKEEQEWLHALDHLELLLWCLDQEAMGNQHVQRVHENLTRWFETHEVPQEVAAFLGVCGRHNWRRTVDFLG